MDPTARLTEAFDARGVWDGDGCPIARGLEIVSTRSAFLILREAFYGATRFDEFVARVGISESVASARLRDLVDHGVLTLVPYQDPRQRVRHAYHLTERGADLFPVLLALAQWSLRWLDGPDDERPAQLIHTNCGEPVSAQLRCRRDHEVNAYELTLVPNT